MKKRGNLLPVLLSGAVILGGCGLNTKVQVVVPKEKKEQLVSEEGQKTLAEQVQAPERYQCDRETDYLHLSSNARVIIPNVEGIKLKKVKTKNFVQENIDAISDGLFQDGGFYIVEGEDEKEKMGSPINIAPDEEQYAKDAGVETEKEIAVVDAIESKEQAKAMMEDIMNGKPYALEIAELLAVSFQGYAETEPDFFERQRLMTYSAICEEIASFEVTWRKEFEVEDSVRVYHSGLAYGGKDVYLFYVDNSVDGLTDITIYIGKGGVDVMTWQNVEKYAESYGVDLQKLDKDSLSTERAMQESQELMKTLGLTDVELAEIQEKSMLYYLFEGDEESKYGVRFQYSRTVDGIPITYVGQPGSFSAEEDGVTKWPREQLYTSYDEGGLVDFFWSNPIEVEDWHDEYAFLLPFSEIQKIFEEMMLSDYEGNQLNYLGYMMDINIQEVRLGYVPVASKEVLQMNTNQTIEDGKVVYSGILVPAWDFLGTAEGETAAKYGVMDGTKISYMTINAMDGSIIQR